MPVVALTPLVCGGREVAVGDEVPSSVVFAGRERPVDHEDLIARGLAERRSSSKSSGSRKTSGKGSAGAE